MNHTKIARTTKMTCTTKAPPATKMITRREVIWCLLLGVLPTIACADAELEGTNPAQWRVVWASDPATAATICWNTAEAGTRHFVRVRLRGNQDWRDVDCHRSGRYQARLFGELYYQSIQVNIF